MMDTKKEAVRLRVEELWSFPMIREKLGIKSDAKSLNGYENISLGSPLRIFEVVGIRNILAA
jgi:hypothetical protein